jgi:hypothetical protein
MPVYYTQSEFAKKCGVVRATISRAVKVGTVAITENGIDPANPTNVYYLEQQARRHAARKRRPKTQAREVPPIPGLPKRKPGRPPTKIVDHSSLDEDGNPTVYDRPAAELARVQAQTNKINLSIAERLGTLVPREEVAKAFGKIYSVSVNHLLTMGDRLAPLLAGICGTGDQETVIKLKNKIDHEITRALSELKREAAKYDD